MKLKSILLSVLVLLSVWALPGCGGGGGDEYEPAFEVAAAVDGRPLDGTVLPGMTQTLVLAVGRSFELRTSGPVDWTLIVGGRTISGSGNTILYGGATIQEVLETSTRFLADTYSNAPLLAPVTLTLVARSRLDPDQAATINVRLIN